MQVKAICVAYFENLEICQPKPDGWEQEILGDINACECPSSLTLPKRL